LLLVLTITSCGEKAVSQEVSIESKEKPEQISRQFSEVSPPAAIQELRSSLEVYQPQVTIVTPQADEVLQDDKVTVRLQVKDLPIFQDPKLNLGLHLNVIVDNEPYRSIYDLNQPLVLPDLSPGTHTLRVFASRPWDESFKNEGAYAQATFHIFTKSDDNNPDPALPLITYNRPQGIYGAEPILLDFYLTNAPLHLVASSNPNNQIADWRIRCTINGESFVLDRWQTIYLKGFKPGKNWVKLEFLDDQGNVVKNVFNSTIRLITYEPKGKDTLSKIVRGELSAEQLRSIVDPNYIAKPTAPETKVEEPLTKSESSQPKQVEPQPKETPTKEPATLPEQSPQPGKPKSDDFFNSPQFPKTSPSENVLPALPKIIESPKPEPQLEETPKSTQPTEQRFGEFFNPHQLPNASPSENVSPILPEIMDPKSEPQLEETLTPQSTTLPEKIAPNPEELELKGDFNDASPSLNLPLNQPELSAPGTR